jgi:muconolactone D-isomerase
MDFLTFATITPPAGTTEQQIAERVEREAARAAELVAEGMLRRIWRPPLGPGEWKNVGLWSASGEQQLREALDSLPMREWMSIEVLPLSEHPSDPGDPARA